MKVLKKLDFGPTKLYFLDELSVWLRLLSYRFRAIGGPGCKNVSPCRLYAICKNNDEFLVLRCNKILGSAGRAIDLTPVIRNQIVRDVIENMASNGLRTIALAFRDFPSNANPDWDNENEIVQELTCICLVGIEDPVRPEVSYKFVMQLAKWLETSLTTPRSCDRFPVRLDRTLSPTARHRSGVSVLSRRYVAKMGPATRCVLRPNAASRIKI